ncbi:MAG: response regulator [Pseudomonadota bacterium]|nr:response regulator [Pseudomonadota bacterium]
MTNIRSYRALIIEDDFDIQYLLKSILESENFLVEVASDGKSGLQKLNNGAVLPDVILLDLMMPIMDGRAFRKAQRKIDNLATIPTIVMTAGREDQSLKDELCVFGFMQKPVDIEVLLGIVNRAISSA